MSVIYHDFRATEPSVSYAASIDPSMSIPARPASAVNTHAQDSERDLLVALLNDQNASLLHCYLIKIAASPKHGWQEIAFTMLAIACASIGFVGFAFAVAFSLGAVK